MPRFVKIAISSLCLCLSTGAAAGSVEVAANAVNEPARWALGLSLGAPTGVSAKRYLGGGNAFDLNVDAIYGPGLRFGADYLFGLAELLRDRSTVKLDLYLGFGPVLGVLQGPCAGIGDWRRGCDGGVYLGARMPIGLEVVFSRAPFSLGLEVAPGFAIASGGGAGFLLDATLLARVLL